MVAIVVFITVAISFLAYISPPKDDVGAFHYPPEFFCAGEGNRIDYQTDGKCAAYAAAYLLRHFGEDADAEELFPKLKRPFGFIPANSITDVFGQYGYQAKACHGNVDTLKQRLSEGNPIIVFIRIPGDTHYAVVVGYDEQHIYLVDSLAENANVSDAQYNRILTTEDFEAVWKTGTLLPDNIYITFFNENLGGNFMNTILNFIHVAGNVLLHSIRTATFCWVAVALAVAVLVIRGVTRKKSGKEQENNYCLEGMSLSMCFGLLAGTMLESYIGVAISLGMIVGLAIGMLIPRKVENGDK